jgi:predicted GH43/DUF377 family glycosyl hydrolase
MKSYFTVFCFLMLFVASTFTASFAQLPWTKDANNPILSGGASGTWHRHVMMPNVLYNTDSSRYEMWYSATSGSPLRPYRIGFATSPDGISSWTLHPNPVLEPDAGTWDQLTVEGPMVIRENGQYKMWYTGWGDGMGIGIGYATSPDGINWTKDTLNNPVMRTGTAAWEEGGSGYGIVIPVSGGYKMWYTGWNAAYTETNIGYATSQNGINWQKDTLNNPVLTIGTPRQWDNPKIMLPQVVFLNSLYHMWYTGGQIPTGTTRKIGWATSVDGIQWNKYSDPVLTPTSGQWDGSKIETGTVMLEGDSLRMWYSGWRDPSSTYLIRIGHATAPLILNVPDNFTTIQDAIDAASDGNIVLVDEGTYYENINFKGKAITVASQFYMDDDTSHISKTIIDGSQASNPDSGSVVYFISGEDTTSVLMGFTITGGTGTKFELTHQNELHRGKAGGGIVCWYSGGRFTYNKIIYNTLSDDNGYVIGGGFAGGHLGSNAHVILENNQILYNEINSTQDGAFGGGVALACNGKLIDNNVISYNSCTSMAFEANGGGIKITAESELLPRTVLIQGNKITHNFAEGKKVSGNNGAKGGGIVNHYCKVIILENDILYNQLNAIEGGDAYGAGISMVIANNESLISRNTISFNTIAASITNSGGGILLRYSDILVTNNIISKNAASNGGGISSDNYGNPEIINNTIVNNTATSNGGGLYSTNSNPVVVNTILWANEATNGSQIYGSGYVLYSDIQGGWSGEGNIDTNPGFADSLFNLSDTSFCVGNGIDSVEVNNTWYKCPSTDYYGHPRPVPVDKFVDMGAVESPFLQVPLNISTKDLMIPTKFELKQNYPNPFNPITMINYQLPITNHIQLSIYNLLGQKVVTLVSEKQKAGYHQVEWDASGFASGVYYYQLWTDSGIIQTKKLVLLR